MIEGSKTEGRCACGAPHYPQQPDKPVSEAVVSRGRLVALLRALADKKAEELAGLHQQATDWAAKPDWPWIGIVMSGATRGSSARWGKFEQDNLYEKQLAWVALDGLNCCGRRARFLTVGRFKGPTADMLEHAWQRFASDGGPAGVRVKLATLSDEAVIDYWASIPGISDKYARNMMMDVRDKRFLNRYFAIDSRIANLLPLLGYTGRSTYDRQEFFLRQLAADAGLDCWTLDRVLYNFADDVTEGLQPAAP